MTAVASQDVPDREHPLARRLRAAVLGPRGEARLAAEHPMHSESQSQSPWWRYPSRSCGLTRPSNSASCTP
jgi:hypothetical protein